MSQKTPYIGSTISLVSKLNIRYEGILFTVNSAESTIALAQVRSFGTENRPTSRPVPVRNDVYEYIIFQASDIKDLVVCDTPKENINETQVTPKPTELSLPNNSTTSPPQVDKNNGFSNDAKSNTRQIRTNSNRNYNNFNTIFHPRTNNNSVIPLFNRHNQKDRLKFDSDYDFEKANEQFQHTLNSLGLDIEKINFENIINKKSEDVALVDQESNVGLEKELKKENNDYSQETKADNNIKEIIGIENKIKNLESFYDKKSSFFDCISCETQEKEEGKNIRPDWKKERQTNQETFGHSAVRSLAFRRNRGSSTSGFRLYNNNIKNRSFNYRSGPISNYQGSGNYSNYNSYINNNYNQQKNRHYPTQRFNNGAGLDVDNGMNNYRRRTVGSRLRAF